MLIYELPSLTALFLYPLPNGLKHANQNLRHIKTLSELPHQTMKELHYHHTSIDQRRLHPNSLLLR